MPAGAGEALLGGARAIGLMAAALGRALLPLRVLHLPRPTAVPERLLVVPPAILRGDAALGAELYAGRFALAGQLVDTGGQPIFSARPPSPDWAAALHGFGWLTHLAAADTPLARAHARALIEDWIEAGGRTRAARDLEVTARRVLAWLIHAPFLLQGASTGFHRLFLRSLARQSQRLRHGWRAAPPGVPRLTGAIALTAVGLAMADGGRTLRAGTARLARELAIQILPDGGHAGRSPAVLIDILVDLLPLRATFAARQAEPPAQLLNALDRMLPMLRFFRHGDGNLALMNGMGPTPKARIEAILAFDDSQGRPVLNAQHSGYQRLEAKAAVLIADTGRAPPPALSADAHAGCLAFEFSAGAERLIVNCGASRRGGAAWRRALRATAAHSTATIGEASSARFARGIVARLIGALVLAGPSRVPCRREDGSDGTRITARHNGYAARFGLLHERTLTLAAGGERLDGIDLFHPARPGAVLRDDRFALRFHIHPDTRASLIDRGRAVLLATPSGRSWLFAAGGRPVEIAESAYLADAIGPRRAEQIVVHGRAGETPEVEWSLARAAPPEAPPRESRDKPDELPL